MFVKLEVGDSKLHVGYLVLCQRVCCCLPKSHLKKKPEKRERTTTQEWNLIDEADTCNVSNFKPVSIYPIMSKTFEKNLLRKSYGHT